MKTIIFFIAIFLFGVSMSFSQSLMNYEAGTGLQLDSGADICADSIQISGAFSGEGTKCGSASLFLHLTVFIQGFYDALTDSMVSDTAIIYLRTGSPPYTIVDSSKDIVVSNGTGTFVFNNALNGVAYYIEFKHRNSIETWSSSSQSFSSWMLTYDFSSSSTQAFGNNMIQVDASPVRFAIYSGDVNQNGSVDAQDLSAVDNDAFNFATGYINTDVTGNNVTDAADLAIADNNAFNFVSKITPP